MKARLYSASERTKYEQMLVIMLICTYALLAVAGVATGAAAALPSVSPTRYKISPLRSESEESEAVGRPSTYWHTHNNDETQAQKLSR